MWLLDVTGEEIGPRADQQIPRLDHVRETEKRQNRAKIKPGDKKDNGCSKKWY